MIKRFKILILIVFLLINIGCEEEKIEIDPTKAILGKWETIEIGTFNNMYPKEANGYIEYKQDSVTHFFDYERQEFIFQRKYWIDSLLHISQFIDDNIEIVESYEFEFVNKNQLIMDYQGSILFNRSILKRIE